jgi:uncharacterized protein (TIGR03000 family)
MSAAAGVLTAWPPPPGAAPDAQDPAAGTFRLAASQSFYPPPTAGARAPEPLAAPAARPTVPTAATVQVRVPAGAELWFEGSKTSQRGEDRVFTSPPLDPSGNYVYEVRARWTENGDIVERTRTIRVRAGERTLVDFASPAK